MEIAFRAAFSADLDGLFELCNRLVPVARARRREGEVAERVGAFGNAALLLQVDKALLIRFRRGRIDLTQAT